MSEVILRESTDTSDAIDSKIKGILNPTLHHHDLLQSYVRAPVEGTSGSKQFEEPVNKSSSLDTCLATETAEDVDRESRTNTERRKKKNNKKQQKEKPNDKLSVESEMNIQKKKK
ncbi:uncharacterized protein LOC143185438 [Calliopsis andreniformis]|uniref:uncharacterized protein LOC143185438 n=1 Tax=Calliopsis andreniformis TaxID=337506 RepID=UPI003FCCE7A7